MGACAAFDYKPQKARKTDRPYDNIFSGLVKCADCGYALSVSKANRTWNSDNIIANYDYQCNNYRMEGKAVCTQHRISALSLYNAVLEDIRRLASEALDDDRQMISSIAERLGKNEKDSVRQAERELKRQPNGLRNSTNFSQNSTRNTSTAR